LPGTRKAKKRCILSIKIKNPENSVFFERKRMLKKEAAEKVVTRYGQKKMTLGWVVCGGRRHARQQGGGI
jgi:hypothetical protein